MQARPSKLKLENLSTSNDAMARCLQLAALAARSDVPVVLLGETGTGKTHLMTALCVQACQQRKRVRFVSAASLINELVEAQRNGLLSRALHRWKRWELLCIDEMGYVPLEETGAELLFQVITERAEK